MTKIKVLCGFKERAGGPFFEYAPGWVFTQDRDCRDYDWLVVFDEMPVACEELACPREHTILATWEPMSIKSYSRAYTRQFGHLLTNRPPDEFAACRYDLTSVVPEEDAVSDTVWNKLYPRAILGDLRFDETVRYSEDVVFTTVLRLRVRPKFWRIPLDLHYYTDNPDSMTRVKFDAENFRRRGLLHRDRDCLKDVKYYLVFLYLSLRYGREAQ